MATCGLWRRGCAYTDHYGQERRDDHMDFMDQGEQRFTYALAPSDSARFDETVRQAALLNRPPMVIPETHHDGDLPPIYEGIRTAMSIFIA